MKRKAGSDQAAAWLRERRHGGDPEVLRRTQQLLNPIRDQVIAGAAIDSGKTVLDVGCGDGLIAFGAVDAVAPAGQVIFSDVSDDLLDDCRERASELGVLDSCRFVNAPARDLSPVADQAVDAVTLRSVLIFEADKAAAFAEFYRVLRPGGRLSLFEPINSYGLGAEPNRLLGYDIEPVADLGQKLGAIYKAIHPTDDPMIDFDERDLVRFAEAAGFDQVHLQFNVAVAAPTPVPWDAFVNIAGNPRIPTLAEAMLQTLTSDEADRFSAHLRPLVEHGRGRRRTAASYLWANRQDGGATTAT